MSCLICLEPITKTTAPTTTTTAPTTTPTASKPLKCIECGSKVCRECVFALFENFDFKFKVPGCLECGVEYEGKSIYRISPKLFAKFIVFLADKLKNDYGDRVVCEYTNALLLKKLRNRKIDYIHTLPDAISLIAKVAMKKRFAEILKKSSIPEGLIPSPGSSQKKKCMNYVCNGELSPYSKGNLKCDLCEKVFCERCELSHPLGVEKCDEGVLVSLKYLNENVKKCPKCSTRIEKDGGCNAMTCGGCGQNFTYSTETLSRDGNHGANKFKVPETQDNYSKELISRGYSEFAKLETPHPFALEDVMLKALGATPVDYSKVFSAYSNFKVVYNNRREFYRITNLITELPSNPGPGSGRLVSQSIESYKLRVIT